MNPERGENALLAAATSTTLLHAIPRHGVGATRINVGKLHAGTGRNVIAPYALMSVETRAANDEIEEFVLNKAYDIIYNTANIYGVKAKVTMVGEAKSFDDDPEFSKQIAESARKVSCIEHINPPVAVGGSDDCSYFISRVRESGGKATYLGLGGLHDVSQAHHTEGFHIDPAVTELGVEYMLQIVWDLQG